VNASDNRFYRTKIMSNSEKYLKRLEKENKTLKEALEQAIHQLELDYEATPLDGRAALIRKLRSVL